MPWTFADVAAHWDSVAYDESNAKIDSYLRRFVDSAPLFTISENARVLDIDCRTGNGTLFFKEKYPTATFTCIAMAGKFKEVAEQKFREKRLQANVDQLRELPLSFATDSFDVILNYETIEHVPDPSAFIKELSRVLKPGGTLVLTTPNLLWEPVHWLSATLHLDHGEGPHRMQRRSELLRYFRESGLSIEKEQSFVLVPAGPRWLLGFGKFLENISPEFLMRALALRRTFICKKQRATNDERRVDDTYAKIQRDLIDTDLYTECGSPVGLSKGLLKHEERNGKLIPVPTSSAAIPVEAYEGCAARDCNYPELNRSVFGKLPENWLSGVVEQSFIGHAKDEHVRRSSASGGVITAMLLHLLETKRITGVVCLKMGVEKPWKATPIIARTAEEIIACSGSVYSVTPTNEILGQLEKENGALAYIGLPDQVAAIRKLQMMKHPSVKNIQYVFGPYTGTQMKFEAIRSFLRSHGVRSEDEIADLKYRAGEWPGHLQITLKNGHVLKAEKFHYNYLIPFFIADSSLQIPDFTNELTDISVGDAWSPKYEAERGGHSVVLARSKKGVELLEEMKAQEKLSLEPITLEEALDMHGHMLDFKKRGSFIRNSWKKTQPDYGYRPAHIPASRVAIEWCLWMFFRTGRTHIARWTVEHLPLSIVGPVFNVLRKSWKNVSKPTKRKGLRDMKFIVE